MVAPSYALARSQLAKKIGLGKPATKQVEPAPPPKKAAGRKKRASA
jgi:predicted transcriptional regulator